MGEKRKITKKIIAPIIAIVVWGIFCIGLALLSEEKPGLFWKNSINKITMDIFIDSEGNAYVTEVWDVFAYRGTEISRPFENSATHRIENISVKEGNVVYEEQIWNKEGDFNSKKYKYGTCDHGDRKELCWGISEYGRVRFYTISYKITNIINQYKGAQGVYFSFIPIGLEPEDVDIKIHSDQGFIEQSLGCFAVGCLRATESKEDGTIYIKSNGCLSEREYMKVFILTSQNSFANANPVDQTYQEVNQEALKEAEELHWQPFEPKPIDYKITISIVLCLLGAIIVICFSKYKDAGKSNVRCYPPAEFNSMEMAFFYKAEVTVKDIMSLALYLANKGFLKIEISKTAGDNLDTEYTFVKLKEYDGSNDMESEFFNALFETGNIVTEKELGKRFTDRLQWIKDAVNDKENKAGILQTHKLSKAKIPFIILLLVQILITARPLFSGNLYFVCIKNFVFIIIISLVVFGGGIKKRRVLVTIVSEAIVAGLTVSEAFFYHRMYIINFILGVVTILVWRVAEKYISERNSYGKQILDKILEFKRFLNIADVEEFESLRKENPMYFYDILPYAYVMESLDVWQEAFEPVDGTAPAWWCNGEGVFTIEQINRVTDIEKEDGSFKLWN